MAVRVKDKPQFQWRVKERCDNCPFNDKGPGFQLRQSLGTQRWDEIVASVANGSPFPCHKTTKATGHSLNLYCAGALAFQASLGIETAYIKLCRAFEGTQESKKELFKRLLHIARRSQ